MNNYMSMLKNFIQSGGSPEKLIKNMCSTNPVITNLMGMASKGNTAMIETFARNIFKQKGRDFDKEFQEFKNTFMN